MGHLIGAKAILAKRIARATKLRDRYIASAQCGTASVRQRMHIVCQYTNGIENAWARLEQLKGFEKQAQAMIVPEWDIYAIICEADACGDKGLAAGARRIAAAAIAKHGNTMQL